MPPLGLVAVDGAKMTPILIAMERSTLSSTIQTSTVLVHFNCLEFAIFFSGCFSHVSPAGDANATEDLLGMGELGVPSNATMSTAPRADGATVFPSLSQKRPSALCLENPVAGDDFASYQVTGLFGSNSGFLFVMIADYVNCSFRKFHVLCSTSTKD